MRRILLLTLLVLPLAAACAEEPKKPPEGFKSLFNGKDLEGWKATGKKEVWGADNDAGVIFVAGGGGGYLMTEKEYGDFELRFEYKMPKNANSGVALRSPLTGDPAYVGMEIQLIDDINWKGLQTWQHTGSIYNVVPASKLPFKGPDVWNTMWIVCKGRNVTIEVNGEKVVDADLDEFKKDEHKDLLKKHPGLLREKGHLGFQSYNVRVEFRNIWLKEL
jgi:hypothetical protein